MRYGIILPLINGKVTENIDFLKNITNPNIDSIWVRDVVISSKDNSDSGSRISPFLHLSKLAEADTEKYILGTGVLSAIYRNVEVTIQDMISLSELYPNSNFIYAIGIGGKKRLLTVYILIGKRKIYIIISGYKSIELIMKINFMVDLQFFISNNLN